MQLMASIDEKRTNIMPLDVQMKEAHEAYTKDDTDETRKSLTDKGLELSAATNALFDGIKVIIDDLFGIGIYDALTQGYQDEELILMLIDEAMTHFNKAMNERKDRMRPAMLSRDERRAKK